MFRAAYRIPLGIILLATSLLGVPTGEAHAKAPSRPTLARLTTISGATSGYAVVRLARSATLEQPWGSPREPVRIRGAGFVGFALVEEVPSFDGVTLIGGRFSSLLPPYVIGMGERLGDSSEGFRIPAGDYRLYLITERRNAQVTLALGGLEGRRFLSPNRRVATEVVSPTPYLAATGRREVFSAGEAVRLGGRGLLFDVVWHLQPVHLHTEYWFCSYAEYPEGPVPYAPGCPSTSNRIIMTTGDSDVWLRPTGGSVAGLWAPLPKGTYGSGASYLAGQPITASGYTAAWVALETGTSLSIESPSSRSGARSDRARTGPGNGPGKRVFETVEELRV